MYDKDINLKDPKGNLDDSYSNLGVHKSQVQQQWSRGLQPAHTGWIISSVV